MYVLTAPLLSQTSTVIFLVPSFVFGLVSKNIHNSAAITTTTAHTPINIFFLYYILKPQFIQANIIKKNNKF